MGVMVPWLSACLRSLYRRDPGLYLLHSAWIPCLVYQWLAVVGVRFWHRKTLSCGSQSKRCRGEQTLPLRLCCSQACCGARIVRTTPSCFRRAYAPTPRHLHLEGMGMAAVYALLLHGESVARELLWRGSGCRMGRRTLLTHYLGAYHGGGACCCVPFSFGAWACPSLMDD